MMHTSTFYLRPPPYVHKRPLLADPPPLVGPGWASIERGSQNFSIFSNSQLCIERFFDSTTPKRYTFKPDFCPYYQKVYDAAYFLPTL